MQSDFLHRICNIGEESHIHDIEHNFIDFKKIVDNLKREIQHARENKSETEIPPLQKKLN